MAVVKYRVKECTSSSTGYPASNLSKGLARWETATNYGRESIDLTFDESTTIGRVDLVNNGCAFVEILVDRDKSEDWTVLLPITSLMSYKESVSGINKHRSWIFDSELDQRICKETWDSMRVVCTQEFSKTYPFGLSELTIYSYNKSAKQTINKPNQQPKILHNLQLSESSDEDDVVDSAKNYVEEKPKVERKNEDKSKLTFKDLKEKVAQQKVNQRENNGKKSDFLFKLSTQNDAGGKKSDSHPKTSTQSDFGGKKIDSLSDIAIKKSNDDKDSDEELIWLNKAMKSKKSSSSNGIKGILSELINMRQNFAGIDSSDDDTQSMDEIPPSFFSTHKIHSEDDDDDKYNEATQMIDFS